MPLRVNMGLEKSQSVSFMPMALVIGSEMGT